MRLQDKVALITGGNAGIGLATARLFVAEGAKVVITGRNRETLDAAARELGDAVLALQADTADAKAMERAAAQAVEHFGRLDIVFANAGIGGMTPLGQTSFEAFEQIVRVNLTGVFFAVQAALPHLKSGASIILTSSVHSRLGAAGWSAYAASKGGIRSMGKVLAAELAPRGIRVNVVSPGATDTDIWSAVAPTPEGRKALVQHISRGIPAGRFGEPDEVAKTVLFLASDDASYIQGVDLFVDGGATGSPQGAPIYRG